MERVLNFRVENSGKKIDEHHHEYIFTQHMGAGRQEGNKEGGRRE